MSGKAEEARQQIGEEMREGAAEVGRHDEVFEARQDQPAPHAGRRQDGDHDPHVAADLTAGVIGPVCLVGSDRDLEQQDVERRSHGQHDPDAEIVGEGKLARFGEAVALGDQGTVDQRDDLVEEIGHDDRDGVAQGLDRQPATRDARRRAGIQKRATRRDQRPRHRQAHAGQCHGGGPEPPGASDGQQQRQRILSHDDPGIDAVEKARPDQRRMVVEKAVGDGCPDREPDETARQGDLDARREEADRKTAKGRDQDRESGVERRPEFGVLDPGAFGIEPGGGEPQPIEDQGLDHLADGERQGHAAIFGRAQETSQEQADDEVHQRIADERNDDLHGVTLRSSTSAVERMPPSRRSVGRDILRKR